MYTFEKISYTEALELLQQVVQEALRIKKHVAASVAGPEGELIAFIRMDEASPAASVIAHNKAYTSARDRKSTKQMGDFMLGNDRPPAFWGDKSITGFGGGVPIVQQGKVIGGIGISGLSEDEDERIARVAIQAVFKYS
ncbi:MAG TPA: heme-binding protein [Ohtaekwangia sp.]|uniref:GlcG/HbpS family heme-binding protein n=1 Tax=Ohtaekwangia sp. TaxID=2066019 RepID=UPI002F95B2B6